MSLWHLLHHFIVNLREYDMDMGKKDSANPGFWIELCETHLFESSIIYRYMS